MKGNGYGICLMDAFLNSFALGTMFYKYYVMLIY